MNPILNDPRIAALSPEKRALVLRRLGIAPPPDDPSRSPAVSDEALRPLSFAQRRLWILSELEGPAATYNIAAAVQLTGALNRFALEQSLDALSRRHDALRTVFVRGDAGEPTQRVAPPDSRAFALEVERAPAAAVNARASARAGVPFDLARGPLARAVLFETAPDRHVLLLVVHHLVADGWSMGILVRELAALYRGFVTAAPVTLPALPTRYVDYAASETAALTRHALTPLLTFWRAALRGAPETLELPGDRAPRRHAAVGGATVRVEAGAAVVGGLRQVCEQEGASAFAGVLASLAVLLSRYTGQRDLVIGCPFANRRHAETMGIVGFFVNTLPIRMRLDDAPTFREVVRRAQRGIAAAVEHQALPFERLVDELQPDRASGRAPIYQVALAYQANEAAALDLPGLAVEPLSVETGTAKFELTFLVEEAAAAWRLAIEFRTDLFDESTAQRLALHWRRLMAAAATNPDVAVDDLELMSPRQREIIVGEWSGGSRDTPITTTVPELFAAVVAARPAAVAIAWAGQTLSYGELAERAGAVAAALQARGVGPGTLVGVRAGRSPEMIAALLGILQTGAGYVPIDERDPDARQALVVRETGVPLILTDAAAGGEIAGLPVVSVQSCWTGKARPTPVRVMPGDVAYVMYTSGSTGTPKGVRIPHRGIVRLVDAPDYVTLGPDETLLQYAPIGFDAATFEIWGALLHGARLVLAPAAPTLPELGATIRDAGVTTLWLTASVFQLMVDEQLDDLCGVRQLLAGGDVLSPAHVARAQAAMRAGRVINGYGPTENTTFTCCHPVPPGATGAVPIGRPIGHTTVYVLDERLRPVPIGIPGELYTGGAGLALDYLGQPALTAARFVPNPFAPGRLYRTGDWVRWRPDGTLAFLGRRDTQIKIRGFRVEPGEIEARLLAGTGVKRAVVVAREGVRSPELVAYVVPTDPGADAGATTAALLAELRAGLPDYMVPAGIVVLPELPLTANGKVDRQALPALVRRAASQGAGPATETERRVAAIFQELLGTTAVGAGGHFFDLGGNSLVATQLASRLRRDLAVDLPLRQIFDTPEVTGLAAACDAIMARGLTVADTIPAVDRRQPLPLSFAQERLWFLHRLEPDNPFYNVAVALEIHGDLDAALLERALQSIVARHEVLRTTYAEADGRPVQVVRDEVPLPLTRLDLRAQADRRAAMAQIARDEARRPFDLEAGPVARATLVALADTEQVLLLTMHHVASDGWSMGVLVRELMALYCGDELAPLPLQYADFAAWQRRRLASDEWAAQTAYWTRQFERPPGELALPTDRPRPPVQSFAGGSLRFEIDREVLSRLQALGRETDATLFMTLLAAFAGVLSRHAGQPDLVIGSPIANRTRAELEPLIGFFVNTLALRLETSGAATFRDLVRHVRTVALQAYANQDLPFERLVDLVQPVRDLSQNPLFQVMFALQNAPVPALDLPGLRAVPMDIGRTTAQFDLVLDMWEVAPGLTGVLEYSADLFDAATAERLVGHFTTLWAAGAASPDRPLADLSLLTDLERRRLLECGAGETVDFPIDRTLHALAEDQVRIGPDRIAVECGAARLTYAELNAHANRIAHRLRRLGVRRGEFVGILLDRCELMSAGILGVLKAGAAYVPVDPMYPPGRIAHMLNDSGVRVVLAREATAASAAGHDWPPVEWLAVDVPIADEPDSDPGPLATAGDPAYMLYTSGSTGLPKGAVIRHDGKINHLYAQFRALAFHRDSAFLQTAPISSDISVWQYLAPLLVGGRTVIATHDTVCDPAALWALLRTSRVTITELVPVALAALLDHVGTLPVAERRLDHLAWMMATGEGVPPGLVNRWLALFPGIPLVNAYGPTEAADDITQAIIRAPLPEAARTVSIGRPLANLTIYVLDPALHLTPVGVPGEICVAGVGVGDGYWGDEVRTRDRFVANPYPTGSRDAVLYRTGDLGVWRPDGTLDCLSRLDEQVKIRGFRIELGEIEAALSGHPAVGQAVVIAREETPGSDKSLVAYVVPDLSVAEVGHEVRQLRADQIALWQQLHDDEYRQRLDEGDPTFDVIGWDSTYTGAPLPTDEMREYVDGTVARILAARPRRLLEIGCGTGLIMFRMLPHLETYTGLDFSKTAIDRLRGLQRAADGPQVPGFERAVLLHGPATDLSAIAPGSIDTVVFPSVVQYFPGLDYLRDVIDRVMSVLTPDGTIVFADVRSLPLLESFYAAVAAHKAGDSGTAGAVAQRIVELAHGEQELAIDPAFFFTLAAHDPRLADVVVEPKRGERLNEMTRFRYDVTIRCGRAATRRTAYPWATVDGAVTIDRLRARLQAESGEALCLAELPNARVVEEAALLRALVAAPPDRRVGDVQQAVRALALPGVEPEALRAMAAELGFDLYLSLARPGSDGRLDAAFVRRGGAPPEWPAPETALPWLAYANNPLHERLATAFAPRLRDYLKQRIPQYMVPPALVMLGRLPLTPAGKIDRGALPAPRRGVTAAAVVLPRDPVEIALVQIWSEVLGLETCGVTQNFFEIGGHSLKATQVVSRVKQRLDADLPLRTVFAHPTIEEFARLVRAATSEAHPTSATPILRVPDGEHYPLSHAQRRLWLLSQLDGGSSAYNMPASVLIEGALDRQAIEQAIAMVVARHESLRTTFVVIDGEPRQRVQADLHIPMSFVDLSGTGDEEARARQLLAGESVRPFDLATGPLVRSMLIGLSADRHVLLFNTHHIVSDDWSYGVIIREVVRLYAGLPVAAPRRQYRDYANWQNRLLEGPAAIADRAWWLDQYSGELPTLDLPTDHPRPPVKTYRGDELPMPIGHREALGLRQLATAHGSSLFMTLVAVVKVLLHRYTGQTDLIVVTPIAGRDHPDLEDQVGCYINTMPLRSRLDPAARFVDFLDGLTQHTTAALDHQRYPFDRLVDELALRRDPSRMPVSDVVVVMQNAGAPDFAMPGLAISPFEYPRDVSKYDLHFFFDDQGDTLSGAIVFNPDLFDRDRIERMRAHLMTLLAAVVADPECPIEDLAMLEADERRRLLADFNPAPRPASVPGPTLASWFAATAAQAGNRVALSIADGSGRTLTYAHLDAASNHLARLLAARGVGPDVLVGLLADRSIETIIGLLAIVKAGGAYVPVDPAYPDERVAFIVRDAALKIVVSGRSALGGGRVLAAETIVIDEVMSIPGNPGAPNVAVHADHLAYVIYTSGSTGQPKGVMVTHRNVTRLFEATQELFQFGASDVWTLFHSIAFDFSVWEIWGALLYGGRLVVVPQLTTRSPEDLIGVIEGEEVTVLNQTPSAFRAFAAVEAPRGRAGLASLRLVIFGGEALDVRSLGSWFDRHGDESPRLVNMYGITETTVHVTHRRVTRSDVESGRSVIGRPIDDLRVHVLSRSGEPAPIGVPGEMWVGGDGVARGYLNQPALTAERFVPDPFASGRLYRSGDLARYLPDGDLEYLGRIDDQVKIRGHRIELGEIQAALESLAGVRQALVVTRRHRGDEALVAYLVAAAGVSAAAARDHVRGRLPEYMVPAAVVLLDHLPLTPHGKIDRRALPDPDAASGATESAEPANELEQVIGDVLQGVLEVARIDVNANFFDLGAHSLMLVRAHAALQAARDETIPLVSFYRYPTVRQLAAHLGDHAAAPRPEAGAQDDARAARRRASLASRRGGAGAEGERT